MAENKANPSSPPGQKIKVNASKLRIEAPLTVSIHIADVTPYKNPQGIAFIVVALLLCSATGLLDTHFTSKTRARIPAAIGAALDVPGKCVTQPSPMLVTVTWREQSIYVTRYVDVTPGHRVKRWVHVSSSIQLLL